MHEPKFCPFRPFTRDKAAELSPDSGSLFDKNLQSIINCQLIEAAFFYARDDAISFVRLLLRHIFASRLRSMQTHCSFSKQLKETLCDI